MSTTMSSSWPIASVHTIKDLRDESIPLPHTFWSDDQIKRAWNNRGGKYKDALMCLLIERSQTFRKIPLYAVNQDIDKIMRRLV